MMKSLTSFLVWCFLLGRAGSFQALPIKVMAWQLNPMVMRSSLPHATTSRLLPVVYGNVNGAAADEDRNRATLRDGYTGLSKLYLILSACPFLLTGPCRKFASAAGLVVAAGFSRILSDATDHDRLGSNTYKRLNLGLVAFNLISLATLPGQVLLSRNLSRGTAYVSMYALCQTLGALIGYVGWRRGLGDDANLFKELKDGIQSTLRDVSVTQGRGTIYRNALLTIMLGITVVAGKLVLGLRGHGVQTSLWASGLARLSLVATALYNLKDAGERDRLTGTTFIHLNHLVGLCLLLSGLDIAAQPGATMFAPSSALLPLGLAFLLYGYILHQEKVGNLEYSSVKRRWTVVRNKEDIAK
ncbi:hypothetical protein MHU86_1998 [Fragilaria crotonensis]|nr:hypothetical protein MHU86_1998 [Fragilaria crotonensis]